ncbi:hypothetical protein Zmor_010297 [Zophobas morio]|uniref:Uncharacterized protein n=1 Tax=Zophobas morio TaxID=2755281 RepID=A0AA38IP52_9CUCU|nr:hypothetical protein Zmor_010297 [Zophobas morio]
MLKGKFVVIEAVSACSGPIHDLAELGLIKSKISWSGLGKWISLHATSMICQGRRWFVWATKLWCIVPLDVSIYESTVLRQLHVETELTRSWTVPAGNKSRSSIVHLCRNAKEAIIIIPPQGGGKKVTSPRRRLDGAAFPGCGGGNVDLIAQFIGDRVSWTDTRTRFLPALEKYTFLSDSGWEESRMRIKLGESQQFVTY